MSVDMMRLNYSKIFFGKFCASGSKRTLNRGRDENIPSKFKDCGWVMKNYK